MSESTPGAIVAETGTTGPDQPTVVARTGPDQPTVAGQAEPLPVGLAVVATDPAEQRQPAGSAGSAIDDPTLPPLPADDRRRRKEGELYAGDMVDQYQITGKIGEGGMGKVYSGIQPVIGKKVAVKLLQPTAAANPEVVTRFVQEARAVNQVRSRYIVDIFSFGQLDNGQQYFVMEHLDGVSLRQFIKRRGSLSFGEAHAILRCVGKGLSAAHAVGIIHRDLKPENIIVLEEDGAVSAKILDFGIAKLTGTSASNPEFATQTGMALGTPYYMSPEQARGVGVDHRTDLYALGVIMFEMFTGVLPFAAESYIDLVNLHLFKPPPRPSEVSDAVTGPLEALILRCMAKDPAERPQTMDELLQELSALSGSLRDARFATGEAQALPAAVDALARGDRPAAHTERPRGRSLRLVIAAVAAVMLVAGAGLGYALYWNRPLPSTGGITGQSARPAQLTDVSVSSRPAGAALLIDGADRGVTPAVIRLVPGQHRMRLELAGHRPLEQTLTVVPGDNRPRVFVLTATAAQAAIDGAVAPDPGGSAALVVRAGHPKATYHLDGEFVGRGKQLRLSSVAAGRHTLTVRAPGRRPWTRAIELRPGVAQELEARLERAGRRAGGRKPPEGTHDPDTDPDDTLNPFAR